MRRIDLNERPESREDLASWYAAALAEQESSGLSVAEYADEIGVTATTLYQWRRRLAVRGREGRRRPGSPAGLVEVTVERGTLAANDAETFIVRLGGERSIEVPPRFDTAELGRLVTLLESC